MKKIIITLVALMFAVNGSANIDPFLTDYYHRLGDGGKFLWILRDKDILTYDKETNICKLSNIVIPFATEDEVLTSLLVAESGSVWIATSFVLYKYNGKSLASYTDATTDIPKYAFPNSMAESSDGSIWIDGYGYYSNIGSNKKAFYNNPYYNWNLLSYSRGIAVDGNDSIWMATTGSENYFTVRSKENEKLNLVYQENTLFYCPSITIGSSDDVWFTCTDGVLRRYLKKTGETLLYSNGNYPEIPYRKYTSSDKDAAGNIWFASDSNLLKYDGEKFESYTCDEFTNACSILCDGDIVWVSLKADSLLKFENKVFTPISLDTESGIENATTVQSENFTANISGGVLRVSGNVAIDGISVYDVTGRAVAAMRYGGYDTEVELPICSNASAILIIKVRYSEGETIIKGSVR